MPKIIPNLRIFWILLPSGWRGEICLFGGKSCWRRRPRRALSRCQRPWKEEVSPHLGSLKDAIKHLKYSRGASWAAPRGPEIMAALGRGQRVRGGLAGPLSKDKDAPGPRDWRPNIPDSGSRSWNTQEKCAHFCSPSGGFCSAAPRSPAGRLQGGRAGGAGSGEACVWKDGPLLLQVSPFIPNEENGECGGAGGAGGFYLALMVLFQLSQFDSHRSEKSGLIRKKNKKEELTETKAEKVFTQTEDWGFFFFRNSIYYRREKKNNIHKILILLLFLTVEACLSVF